MSLFLILWGIYVGTELLDPHSNSIFKFLRDRQTVIHSSCSISHFHQPCSRVPTSLHPCQNLFLFVCYRNHLMGMKWHLTVVSICISLTVMLDIFSGVYWPSGCLFWRNVYSSLCPVFNWAAWILLLLVNYKDTCCFLKTGANIWTRESTAESFILQRNHLAHL